MDNTQASAQPATNQPKKTSAARAVFAGIFGVIAFLFFIPLIFSIWISTTLLNSDNFSKTFTAVIINPKVSQQIATGLTESIVNDDTAADLAQAILTPEQAAQDPEQVKTNLKQVFKQGLAQIIVSAEVQKSTTTLLKNVHKLIIESPPKDAQTATLDFRPFIASVINGAKGTKIEIITTKFTVEEGQGVVTLDQNQYMLSQNIVTAARTTLIIQLIIFSLGIILCLAIANRRFRALRRILLTAGILLLLVGLPLYLIPMLIASSSQADIAATFTAVQLVLGPLASLMLIVGGILTVGIIIVDIIIKISSKKTPTAPQQASAAAEPKKPVAKPKASTPKK